MMSSFKVRFSQLDSPREQLLWLAEHRFLGVTGLLVERGLLPAEVADMARPLAVRKGLVSAVQLDEEAQVMTGFVKAGVRALALKGCLLGHGFYPAPNQRWRADLDVLVAPDSVESARQVLGRAGYKPMWQVAGGTPMDQETWLRRADGRRQAVDLHWGLRNHPVLSGLFPFDEQWEQAIALDSLGEGVMGQGPVHALINASMHWFDDMFDQPRPLGWLLDMDLLWRSLDEPGRARLVDLACERGVAGLLAESLAMTRAVFDTQIPDAVIARLTETGRSQRATRLIKAGSNPYRAWLFALRCEPGLTGKLRRVRRSLLPPVAHMRQRYPEGSRFGLVGLYVRRVFRRM